MATRIITFVCILTLGISAFAQNRLSCGTAAPREAQHRLLKRVIEFEKSEDFSRLNKNITDVAIIAHVIRRDNGIGGLTESQLNEALDNVNAFYASANLSFFYLHINYIDVTKYYDFETPDESELIAEYNYDGVINVYFANSVGNGDPEEPSFFCGYAYFPGGPDVILMDNSCTMNGSTFPHEIGHFFHLLHTHGRSNSTLTDELVIRPGEESTGCLEPDCIPQPANCDSAGDLLCDTEADPNVSGEINSADCSFTGDEVDANNDSFRPDGTNIMSYSTKACRDLFSEGQLGRMNATYLSTRNYLHTKNVLAEIDSDLRGTCANSSITFSGERSLNVDSYAWTFEGGTPATSSEMNPMVTYENPGDYSVTLVTTNGEGETDDQTIDGYITIREEVTSSITEQSGSFETAQFDETVLNEDDSFTWEITSDASSEGTNSARMNFISYSDVGQEDYLSIAFNSSEKKTFDLTFDYAYASYNLTFSDGLEIVYRDPCGEWQTVWSKSGIELATAPSQEQSFIPTTDQWTSESVEINVDEAIDVVEIAFKAINGYGNALYIDNYEIKSCPGAPVITEVDGSLSIGEVGDYEIQWYLDGEVIAGATSESISGGSFGSYSVTISDQSCEVTSEPFIILSSPDVSKSISIYPNPVQNVLHISMSSELRNEVQRLYVNDLSGKELMSNAMSEGIDVSSLNSGIYFLTLEMENQRRAIRFIKE